MTFEKTASPPMNKDEKASGRQRTTVQADILTKNSNNQGVERQGLSRSLPASSPSLQANSHRRTTTTTTTTAAATMTTQSRNNNNQSSPHLLSSSVSEKHRWKYDQNYDGPVPGAVAVPGIVPPSPDDDEYDVILQSEETSAPPLPTEEDDMVDPSTWYRGRPTLPNEEEEEEMDTWDRRGPFALSSQPRRERSSSGDSERPTTSFKNNVQEFAGRRRKKTFLLLLILSIVIVLGAVGAGVGIALSGGLGGDSQEQRDSQRTALRSVLDPVSGAETLDDPDSPQGKALNWLDLQDEAHLIVATTDDEEEIKQRYGAAVLYYALQGEGWNQQANFLSRGNICTWNSAGWLGIFCDDGMVVKINLPQNSLVGTIPSEISVFSKLAQLDISADAFSDKEVTGEVPRELSTLNELLMVDLSHNDLTGDITWLLESLNHNLIRLNLNNNFLSGFLPSSIGRYSNLEYLGFFENRLQGRLPTEIGGATSLKNFDVGKNDMTGVIPSELGLCTDLTYLDLGGNDFVGALPTELAQLFDLETFFVCEVSPMQNLDVVCDAGFDLFEFAANICGADEQAECSCCTDCCPT